ncbi:hypothetical protein H5410_041136 [Solanum commersonii]|uniref:Uncharacterized protein n=1 Tax=Solanum commersonii TaxID=4109 RepID=A0A9J5XUK7_SOLCO|nr:hypothetical protein H5410_041136 [Solanum commersonii]
MKDVATRLDESYRKEVYQNKIKLLNLIDSATTVVVHHHHLLKILFPSELAGGSSNALAIVSASLDAGAKKGEERQRPLGPCWLIYQDACGSSLVVFGWWLLEEKWRGKRRRKEEGFRWHLWQLVGEEEEKGAHLVVVIGGYRKG